MDEVHTTGDQAAHLRWEIDSIKATRGWRTLENCAVATVNCGASAAPFAAFRLFVVLQRERDSSPRGTPTHNVHDIERARSILTVADPIVSIVIPVHNHVADTLLCLRAVYRNTTFESFEVIVCDDASSDATREVLHAIKGLKVIRLDQNVGFLVAISTAIEAAKGTYLLMLNNDTEVQPGWLAALVDVAEADSRVGAVGSKLIFPDGRLQEAGASFGKMGALGISGTVATRLTLPSTTDVRSTTARPHRSWCAGLLTTRSVDSINASSPPTMKTPIFVSAYARLATRWFINLSLWSDIKEARATQRRRSTARRQMLIRSRNEYKSPHLLREVGDGARPPLAKRHSRGIPWRTQSTTVLGCSWSIGRCPHTIGTLADSAWRALSNSSST